MKQPPRLIKPMLATLVEAPFDDPEWIFEIKLDGYRALADLSSAATNLYSRSFQSFNAHFPQLVEHLDRLKIDALIDGEIVALDSSGISHFQILQNSKPKTPVYYYVFYILNLNGKELLSLALSDRKKILKEVLQEDPLIRYLSHIEGAGTQFFSLCKEKGLEGIVAKKKRSAYMPGHRSRAWLKIKIVNSQEVIICGFTAPRKTRKHLGALVVGVYRQGQLAYAGHVGSGFSEKKLEEIKNLLTPFITQECPFPKRPKTRSMVTWVKPHYICEVKFQEWTEEGSMRIPIFMGLRTDKPLQSVTREGSMEPLKVKFPLPKYDFLSNLDKIYWEKEGITKKELLDYYLSMAPFILPYLIDRPQSLRRFPNGVGQSSFFQKNIEHQPEWIQTIAVKHTAKKVNYMLIQDTKSLLYAINMGCIELHPWFSNIHHLEHPDFLVFDLDPVAIPFESVIETACCLHDLLDTIGVESVCKTSGGRGLHIGVPLHGKYTFEQAKHFAELIALIVHHNLPKITSLERSPKNRQKKVYIDCYQNNFGQTLAAPYSLRAKEGAPVSTPLDWREVKSGLSPLDFNLYNTLKRVEEKGDLFRPLLGKGMDLRKSLQFLQNL